MDLSLVLTCYNEEAVLARSVEEIVGVLDSMRITYEIVFVDDASRDRTRDVIREIIEAHPRIPMRALFHDVNTGWGGAVADGIRGAGGDIVGFLDVDLEVHPRYIPACCQAVREGAQVAVGARVFKFVARGLWRRFLSASHAALVRVMLPVSGPANTSSGCKFFRRADILPVLATVEDTGWFWDVEMMVQCRLAGLTVAMVPCLYVRNPSKRSAVHVLRDGLTSVSRIMAFRAKLRRAGLLRGLRAPSHP